MLTNISENLVSFNIFTVDLNFNGDNLMEERKREIKKDKNEDLERRKWKKFIQKRGKEKKM